MERPICRCCGVKKANRPRGLCWTCHRQPDSLERFPSTSKFTRRGRPDCNGAVPLPSPTLALPATASKVAEMERRAALGLSLFSPLDAAPTEQNVVPRVECFGGDGVRRRRRNRPGKLRVVWQPPDKRGPVIETGGVSLLLALAGTTGGGDC